jgi:hypothetical protein
VNRLLAFWGLPRAAAVPALYAALFHLLFVAGVTVIKSGTNALYLARTDTSQLPFLYAVVALVVAAATSWLARLQTRMHPRAVHRRNTWATAMAIAATIAAVVANVPHASAVLYVLGEAAATTGSVLFWSRLMDGFTARDHRRVVGVVGAGGK